MCMNTIVILNDFAALVPTALFCNNRSSSNINCNDDKSKIINFAATAAADLTFVCDRRRLFARMHREFLVLLKDSV